MSKYLFVVPPFFGHINPTLGIGAELLNRGHQVAWACLREINGRFVPKGGQFKVLPQEQEEHQKEIDRILSLQDNGTKIRGIEILKFAMEATYIPFCKYMVGGILKVIDDFCPDVIVHDENMFAGAIGAVLREIPYVTSIAVPPGSFQPEGKFPEFEQWQTGQIIKLQEQFGVPGSNKIVYSKRLNLVYTSKDFVGNGDEFPAHYKFVGPIIKGRQKVPGFNFEDLKGRKKPMVYVSLGTLLKGVRKEFFTKIVAAFGNQPLTVIAATDPGVLDAWPDNFIVQSFVPQSELLCEVDAVIYHGGFNTVNEALFHGIPLIIIPMAYDQFHIASLVVNSGSGLSIRYKRLTVEELRKSLWEVVQNPTYKKAATKVGEGLKNAGGTDAAATLLEAVPIPSMVQNN